MTGRRAGAAAIAFVTALAIAPSPAPSFAAQTTLKLGLDLPLSGIDGSAALPARNAVVLAVDDANRRGFPGGGRVELDDLDDSVQGKHDPAQGAQNVRVLAGDAAVVALVGPMNSNVAKAEIPISNASGLAQIAFATTAVELTRGPESERMRAADPAHPAFFRVCATDDRQGAASARFAYAHGLRRAFVIDDNESYGRGIADVFASAFPRDGGTVIGREHLTAFALDYKPLLTKAAALRPDVVFFGGIVSTGGAILRKQMGDAGLGKVAYLGGDGLSGPDFVPLAGAAAEGTYFTLIAPDIERLPAAHAFSADYERRFHAPPGTYSPGAYAAAAVALAAIAKVWRSHPGSPPSRAEVLAAVAATRGLRTPLGPVAFDRAGDLVRPTIGVYRIHGGRVEFVSQSVVL